MYSIGLEGILGVHSPAVACATTRCCSDKNTCRKGGRTAKVLEVDVFFFQLWGKCYESES